MNDRSEMADVSFCQTKSGKLAVIHDNFYFHHNRHYKGGDYWCCAQRGCNVRLSSKRTSRSSGRLEFVRRDRTKQHDHPPNAPNLVEKDFRRQLISQMNKNSGARPARCVYDQVSNRTIQRGVPRPLIPSFSSVSNMMYRLRRNSPSARELADSVGAMDSDGSEPTTGETAGAFPLLYRALSSPGQNPCTSHSGYSDGSDTETIRDKLPVPFLPLDPSVSPFPIHRPRMLQICAAFHDCYLHSHAELRSKNHTSL